LVNDIRDERITILVLSAYAHYDEKKITLLALGHKLQTCANRMGVTGKSDQEIPLIDLAVVFEYFSDFFFA